MIYGSVDNAQSYHAPILEDRLRDESWEHVKICVVPGIGHNMGPEIEGRIGPIDDRVLEVIGRWLETMLTDEQAASGL